MDALQSCFGVLKIINVLFAFCACLFLGALKGLIVGPVASLILILGNVGVILGLFPAHVVWTVYSLAKTSKFDIPLKIALLCALPALFGMWLGLSIAGSVIVGMGYGFFTPWFATFEAFRHDKELKQYFHCIVDGTCDTISGSCTAVVDFSDFCYHSYPLYLKELREFSSSGGLQTLRLIHIPGCIIVGLMGLIVVIPFYTVIAVVKSPYMLFKGWYRLIHDLFSREGPFLETACIPIAGLTIILWPAVVAASILAAIFSSFFIGLYGAVVVYQERSFQKGMAYVIAMVAEFDESTNDFLYLRKGTIFPRPQYRKRKVSPSSDYSVREKHGAGGKLISLSTEAPAILVPSLAHSRSVRDAIQEVKMVQIWANIMKSCEMRGKELLDNAVITPADLSEWQKEKDGNEAAIINVGLPCYSLLHTLVHSIKFGSGGLLMLDDVEITYLNRPHDKMMDWIFHPVMVLKEQIRVLNLEEGEASFLEKVVLFQSNTQRMEAWENGCILPQDALRAAQIQGISRRMLGMVRTIAKLPTYRRRYRNVVKDLVAYSLEKEGLGRSGSGTSVGSEVV